MNASSADTSLLNDQDLLDRLVGPVVGPGQPGLVTVLSRGSAITASACRGLASLELEVPLHLDSRLNIASVSKQFTAAALLVACRDGHLSLNDDLRDHVPELRLRKRVTLRQAAQHTGGLRDYLTVAYATHTPWSTIATVDDVLGLISQQEETDFPPGADISYSNTGYVLLAIAVARATSSSFAAYLRQEVFAPVGMTSSLLVDQVGQVVEQLAASYDHASGKWRREDPYEALPGDGGVHTTVVDLARWLGFLASGDGLGRDLRDQLVAPGQLSNGREHRYSFGLQRARVGGRAVACHGGRMYHYRSHLCIDLATGRGAVTLANRPDLDVALITRRALLRDRGFNGAGAVVEGRDGVWVDPLADRHLDMDQTPYPLPRDHYVRELNDQSFLIEDDLGSLRTYRPATPNPAVTPPTGRYWSREFGVALEISDVPEPCCRVGSADLNPIQHVDNDGSGSLFATANGWLRVSSEPGVLLYTTDGARRVRFERTSQPDQ